MQHGVTTECESS